eukprot:g1791.t1
MASAKDVSSKDAFGRMLGVDVVISSEEEEDIARFENAAEVQKKSHEAVTFLFGNADGRGAPEVRTNSMDGTYLDVFNLIGGDVSEDSCDYDENDDDDYDDDDDDDDSVVVRREIGDSVFTSAVPAAEEEEDDDDDEGEDEIGKSMDTEDGAMSKSEDFQEGTLNFHTTVPVAKNEIDGGRYFPLSSIMESAMFQSRDVECRPLLRRSSNTSTATKANTTPPHDVDGDDVLYGFVIDNVMSEEECAALIDTAEMMSEDDCKFAFWNKSCKSDAELAAARSYRNVDTIEFRHTAFANELWRRIKPSLTDAYARIDLRKERDATTGRTDPRWQPDVAGIWEAYGTNEHVLLGRYGSGGHFAPHTDGYSILNFNTRSMLSIVLYLNECSDGGGDTRFYSDRLRSKLKQDEQGRWTGVTSGLEIATVRPKAGRAVIFFHNHMHEGIPPCVGSRKYIIRSDVMYRRVPPICTKPEDIEAYKLYMRANEAKSPAEAQRLFEACFRKSRALANVFGM